jgi:nitrogen regulatory protein PII
MEMIEAIIKPFKMEEVKDNLTALGINGATITEVRVHGSQQRLSEVFRGSSCWFDFHPMIKLEVAVTPEQKPTAIAAIISVAKTSKASDGRIFVLPLDQAIRIRTEERGVNAV